MTTTITELITAYRAANVEHSTAEPYSDASRAAWERMAEIEKQVEEIANPDGEVDVYQQFVDAVAVVRI